eukprot:SAG31_NODE_482_length_15056_cov_5.057364_3_plen_120_part_00
MLTTGGLSRLNHLIYYVYCFQTFFYANIINMPKPSNRKNPKRKRPLKRKNYRKGARKTWITMSLMLSKMCITKIHNFTGLDNLRPFSGPTFKAPYNNNNGIFIFQAILLDNTETLLLLI